MSNEHLRETEMSLKAKGLLSLMLSLPDNWQYSISGLCSLCKESESAIKAAIAELKSFGYLSVKMKKPNETESGKIEYEYTVFELPQKEGAEPKNETDEPDFSKTKAARKAKKKRKKRKEKCGKLPFSKKHEKQSAEKQGTENQPTEKHGLINTKEQITEIKKTEISITDKENHVKEKPQKSDVENFSRPFEEITMAEIQKAVNGYFGCA